MRRSVLLCALLPALAGCTELREAWRQFGPPPETKVAVRIPAFQQARLANGMQVYVYEEGYLPLLSIRLVVRSGDAALPAAQAGLAHLAYQTLLRGTEAQDSDVALAGLGAPPRLSIGHDGAALGLTIHAQKAQAALEILGEMLQRPRLAEEDFAEVREKALEEVALALAAPTYAGAEALKQVIYGADHPYGQPVLGTARTLGRLGRADVAAFHRRFVGPRNAALVLAGRVTLKEALAWAQAAFGDWQAQVEAPADPPAVQARPRDGIWVVPRAKLAQTSFFFGRVTAAANAPDIMPLRVASSSAAGRIGQRLRTEKGLTYAAISDLELHRSSGHFIVWTAVQADATGKALGEALDQIDRLHTSQYHYLDEERNQKELYRMRAGNVWRVTAEFRGLRDAAAAAAELFLLGRPADHYQEQIERGQKLYGAEVQEAAARYFGPGTMQVVLVGDPEIIAQQVRGRGPLRTWSGH
jgi:predicted Zn-dependent peptidase